MWGKTANSVLERPQQFVGIMYRVPRISRQKKENNVGPLNMVRAPLRLVASSSKLYRPPPSEFVIPLALLTECRIAC